MAGVRPRWLPALGAISNFPELNFRTYVRHNGKPGIYFLSIRAGKRAAVQLSRLLSALPYEHAPMQCTRLGSQFQFHCGLAGSANSKLTFSAIYVPKPDLRRASPESLDEWLVERYRLYLGDRQNRIVYAEVHHEPWAIQDVDVRIDVNSLGQPLGLELPRAPEHAHFSRGVRALAWPFSVMNGSDGTA
jgi:uncharacterized protein YqjF (DUF2071 family)